MNKEKIKNIIVNLDTYLGAATFVGIMFLLFAQVVSRYVFKHAWTWAEELATSLFVWMTYFCISSAVTSRKHLRIDALLNVLPFKVKRALLIVDNVIFIAFNTYLWIPFINLMNNLGNSVTPLLRIPKKCLYIAIPVMLTVATVRLIFDTIRLVKEEEKKLGASKPTLDLDAMEKEWEEKCQRQ